MSKKRSQSIESMEAQRRELDREIRARKRAEKKAFEKQMLSERQSLGLWLCGVVGPRTPEEVRRLRELLDDDGFIKSLQHRLEVDASDSDEAVEDQSAVPVSGHVGPREDHPISAGCSDNDTRRADTEGGGHDDRVA